MTDVEVLIPIGFIWLFDAFDAFTQIVIDKARAEGPLLKVTNPWYSYYRDNAVSILQIALLSAEMQAHYFDDEAMRDIKPSFWRKEEADRTIRRGEIQTEAGSDPEFVFLSAELFKSFARSYSAGSWPPPSESGPKQETGGTLHPHRTRGPRPMQRNRVEAEMRSWQAADLASLTEEAMSAEFGASRETCRKARNAILSEVGKPITDK